MNQKIFAEQVISITRDDPGVIGLAAGGSWINGELDEFSDLDLILVTREMISADKQKMIGQAQRLGNLISAFTGEHVGEPRVLICLYDDPLLHVDIKFLTLPEFHTRVENPVVLFERNGELTSIIQQTQPAWPICDHQWIEDRFWTWVHYLAAKIGRGEYFECLDGLAFLRATVTAPLLQEKNNLAPRGLRKLETKLNPAELKALQETVAGYDRNEIIIALEKTIEIYCSLRNDLFSATVQLQERARENSLAYLEKIKMKEK